MKKEIGVKLSTLIMAVEVLGYTRETKVAVMTTADGGRVTTKLNIFHTPEGPIMLNVGGFKTYQFENEEELKSYIDRKFHIYESEKEMYKDFAGMTEETWNEWNGIGTDDE